MNYTDSDRDVALLQILRSARAEFNEVLVAGSAGLTADGAALLRQDTTFQMCEFYFLLQALNMHELRNFEQFVDRHNDYLGSLLQDADKMKRLGLKKERVLQAIFDGDTRPRLVAQWKEEPGTIDQSNLARFLVAVMSAETARKIVVVFEKAGLMTRTTSIYGSVLIRSTGRIEQAYRDYLGKLRSRILERIQ